MYRNIRKKKQAWKEVAEILGASGECKSPVQLACVANKMVKVIALWNLEVFSSSNNFNNKVVLHSCSCFSSDL